MSLIAVLTYVVCLAVAMPIVAIIACACCIIVIPAAYFIVLAQVLVIRPSWLPEPRRWPQLPADSEPAVLQYFYGPAAADAVHAAQVTFTDCRRRVRHRVKAARKSSAARRPWVAGPLQAAGAAGLTAGIIGGAFAAACCALIHLLVVAISAVLIRVFSIILRSASSAVPLVSNRPSACPSCSEQISRPGYICPGNGCKRRHRNPGPGQLGILKRRCLCGTQIDTLPLSRASQMVAFCPHCGQLLEHSPGEGSDIELPVFGTSGTATAQLLLTMAVQLRTWDREGHLTAVPTNLLATPTLGAAARVLRSGNATSPTSPGPPATYITRLITDTRTRGLRIFDAVDNELDGAARSHEPGYPTTTRTFTLAIDPLSADSYWTHLPTTRQAELEPERSATSSPDQAYDQARRAIEATGIDTREARLAVVFTTGDLEGAPSAKVARWARRQLGLGDLVRSVRLSFEEYRFLCVPQPIQDDAVRESTATLMRWLLIDEGISPSPSRITIDSSKEQQRSYRWHRRYVFASTLVITMTLLTLLFTL